MNLDYLTIAYIILGIFGIIGYLVVIKSKKV